MATEPSGDKLTNASGAAAAHSAGKPAPAPFGTLLGVAPGGVGAYSSDYDTADEREYPNRRAYRSYLDSVYLGYKWQCVEFARRWLYVNRGYVFDDVAMAYEIFRLSSVRRVDTGETLPLHAFRNGSRRHPEPGCLLVWDAGGSFEHTGHVAVVVEVLPDRVRIADQNFDHRPWPAGQSFAREIPARITDDGGYWLRSGFGEAGILGWVIQTDDARDAETFLPPEPRLFAVDHGFVADRGDGARSWLNVANPDEAAYVSMMGGHKLAAAARNQLRFCVISEAAAKELERATNELHALFMHATERVLRDDALLARFGIPRAVWPRIRQSWDNRRNEMVTGRFDFTLSERGLKVYEYNCDSASCHMEAGKVQGRWAEHFGCSVGRDAAASLQNALARAWRGSDAATRRRAGEVLHVMIDRDLEETYHALFMKEFMNAAGIPVTLLHGMSDVHWNGAGEVVDGDGVPIRWVWKTWAWETALDQLRAECEDEGAVMLPSGPRQGSPRLVDVLLRREVMVYEPLWTLIPSNKAILPVLWEMFPEHPYLLASGFELTERIGRGGFVTKPIVGRCGANIALFNEQREVIEQTAGAFEARAQIFQEYFPLPNVGGDYVQLCAFTAAGTYAGSCVRLDPTQVITTGSDLAALRVLEDSAFLQRNWPGRPSEDSVWQI
ncbi:MAG TPA: bifunctional glutathionylspermidine amidase/synthase [Pseudomonadales bacterium]